MSLENLSLVVTEEILNATRTVDGSSWCPLTCTDVSREMSKSVGKDGNKSWNLFVKFDVTGGEYKGMKLRAMFNEKFPSPCLDMFAAFLGRKVETGEELQFAPLVGQKVEGYVEKQVDRNDPRRYFNVITQWRPAKG